MGRLVRPISDRQDARAGSSHDSERQTGEATDAELARAARQGTRAAFDALYARHAAPVARRLRRIVGRTEDVEDVLQLIFLEVHRALPRYDEARPFAPWLHGIAFRVTSTFLRTRRRRWWQVEHAHVDTLPESLGSSASPEEQARIDQAARLVWREVEKLAPEKRIAFALFELEQLTVGEIAELMGTSPQTAWARVQSARERVAKQLAKARGSRGEQ